MKETTENPLEMNHASDLKETKRLVEEELIDNFSENISKMQISPHVEKYVIDGKRRLTENDPWGFSDLALRQMHTASRRGPRLRYLPGTYLSSSNARPSTASPATQREKTLSSLPKATRAISARGSRSSGRPISRLSVRQVTTNERSLMTLSRANSTESEARSETSLYAEYLVGQSLPMAAMEVQMDNMAENLSRRALNSAIASLNTSCD